MSSGAPHSQSLLATYGRLATRLARAIVGRDETADEVVRSSAELCAEPHDWIAFFARVRGAALARRADAGETARCDEVPSPRHPGDFAAQRLPVDAALLDEAYSSLSEGDRTTLWRALLGRLDAPDPDRLAAALARLQAAVARTSFPSAEDIP